MRLHRTTLFVTLLACATACGGRASREPEAGQSGAAGGSGADACAAGKEAYWPKRKQVLQQLSASGCTTDADCGALWETNACASTCGTPASAAGIEAATKELSAFAQDACAKCAPIPTPPCAPPGVLKCVQGQCSEER